jgi:3'-5' exonuclease
MSRKVFLDCETIPPDKTAPLLRDRIQGCSEEEFRKLALDPEYGRLLCIGLIIEEDNQIIHRGTLGRDKTSMLFHLDEARILRAFWKLIKGFDPYKDLLIGFNILDFDLHWVYMKSVIHKVKPSIDIPFARFRNRPVYDVMWEFEHWRRKISLDELAKILDMVSSKQSGIDGSCIFDLFIQGRHQEIADYCMRDVELTRAIYKRMSFSSTEIQADLEA